MEKQLEGKTRKKGTNKELRLRDVLPGYKKQAFAKVVSANSSQYLDEI
jgi:hypothetical protein